MNRIQIVHGRIVVDVQKGCGVIIMVVVIVTLNVIHYSIDFLIDRKLEKMFQSYLLQAYTVKNANFKAFSKVF